MTDTPIAGWYDDPSGQSQLRYWNGTSWTEHVAPRPTTAEPVTAPLPQAAPSPVEATRTWQPAEASPWAPAQPGPTAPDPWTTAPQPTTVGGHYSVGGPDVSPTERTSQGTSSKLVLALVVGAIIVVGALVAVIVGLYNREDPEPAARPAPAATPDGSDSPTPADEPTEAEVEETAPAPAPQADGGSIELGAIIGGDVPTGGEWSGTLSISEPTALVVDVRTLGNGDLTVVVEDAQGNEVTSNDDREFLDIMGMSSLDPAVGVFLEPGDYTVRVSEYEQSADTFQLATFPADAVLPADGTAVSGEVRADGTPWVALMEIPEGGTYGIGAVASTDDADPVLGVIAADGTAYEDDDSHPMGERNPLVMEQLQPGTYLVVVGTWDSAAASVEVTATK